VPYLQRYLFNAIPDTNHNANPTNSANPNTRYRCEYGTLNSVFANYSFLYISLIYVQQLFELLVFEVTSWRLNVTFLLLFLLVSVANDKIIASHCCCNQSCSLLLISLLQGGHEMSGTLKAIKAKSGQMLACGVLPCLMWCTLNRMQQNVNTWMMMMHPRI